MSFAWKVLSDLHTGAVARETAASAWWCVKGASACCWTISSRYSERVFNNIGAKYHCTASPVP
jgi:hypothetical protein